MVNHSNSPENRKRVEFKYKLIYGAFLLHSLDKENIYPIQNISLFENIVIDENQKQYFQKIAIENRLKYGDGFYCQDFCCNEKTFCEKLINIGTAYKTTQYKKAKIQDICFDEATTKYDKQVRKTDTKKSSVNTNIARSRNTSTESITGRIEIIKTRAKKKQCSICSTTKTTIWRRYKGMLVCNACGLYHKKRDK